MISLLENDNESLLNQIESLQQEIAQQGDYQVEESESVEEKNKTGFSSKVAPRLFCDICDEFDLHDTEDCPQQNMSQQEADDQAAHSKYNATKQISRAYCDLCESFGHEEVDCNKTDKAPSDEEF